MSQTSDSFWNELSPNSSRDLGNSLLTAFTNWLQSICDGGTNAGGRVLNTFFGWPAAELLKYLNEVTNLTRSATQAATQSAVQAEVHQPDSSGISDVSDTDFYIDSMSGSTVTVPRRKKPKSNETPPSSFKRFLENLPSGPRENYYPCIKNVAVTIDLDETDETSSTNWSQGGISETSQAPSSLYDRWTFSPPLESSSRAEILHARWHQRCCNCDSDEHFYMACPHPPRPFILRDTTQRSETPLEQPYCTVCFHIINGQATQHSP